MMFTHFFKFYKSCKGANSLSEREDKAQNGTTARNFLTMCTQKVHEEQISKQGRIIRSQLGRSMVEMLGVLAIVGVLSVGGISGYSKAMMKYKINKFTVAMNELLNTAIQYTGQLNSDSNYTDTDGAQYFADILYKMKALPDGIKRQDNVYLTDMFGNRLWVFFHPVNKRSGIGYRLSLNSSNKLDSEICHQLVKIAKENSSQLEMAYTENAHSPVETSPNMVYGDAYCNKNTKCLKNLTISDIDTMCHTCIDGAICRFYFLWR